MFNRLVGVIACFVLMTASVPAFAANPLYSITAIRAYLYYDDTGTIGTQDIIAVPDGSLFNTVIGEGIADRPSNTTLLVIEVSGPSFASKDVGTLIVKALVDFDYGKGPVKTVVLERSVNLNTYFQEKQPNIKVPFFLYQTGHLPVTVTATLKGGKDAKGQTSVLTQKIRFSGGE